MSLYNLLKRSIPDEILDLTDEDVNNLVEDILEIVEGEIGEDELEELNYKLRLLKKQRKWIIKQKRKYIKSVEDLFPCKREMVVKCKWGKEIIFISCYIMMENTTWKVNSTEVKIEINHEGMFISSNQSKKPYKYKINYYSIRQRSQHFVITSMSPSMKMLLS